MAEKKTATPKAPVPRAKKEPSEPKAPPAKASKSVQWVMRRNGTCKGAVTGDVYVYSVGDTIPAPEGDLEYLGDRYAKKL